MTGRGSEAATFMNDACTLGGERIVERRCGESETGKVAVRSDVNPSIHNKLLP